MCETRQVNHRPIRREVDSSSKPRTDRPHNKNNNVNSNSGIKRHEKPVDKEDGFQVVRKKKM